MPKYVTRMAKSGESESYAIKDAAAREQISAEVTARENAVSAEATARENAVSAEASARGTAVSAEATAREMNDNSIKNALRSETGITHYYLNNGHYINTVSPIDITNILVNANNACAVIPCVEGDKFFVTGYSNLNAVRVWTFINGNGVVLLQSGTPEDAENKEITAPANSAYLVFNSNINETNPEIKDDGMPLKERIINLQNVIKGLDHFENGAFCEYIYSGASFLKYVNSGIAKISSTEAAYAYFSVWYKKEEIMLDETNVKNSGILIYNHGNDLDITFRLSNSYDFSTSQLLCGLTGKKHIKHGMNKIAFNKNLTVLRTPNNYISIVLDTHGTTGYDMEIEYLPYFYYENEEYDMVFWGDSITAGAGGATVTFPGVCASELQGSYYNGGVGGESAYVIACRAGGDNFIIPPGNVNGNYQNTDIRDYFLRYPIGLLNGTPDVGVNPITINGIECTLTRTGAETYSISGYTGDPIKHEQFIECSGSRITAKLAVIMIGHNMTDSITIDQWFTLIDNIGKKYPQFIVLGIITGTAASRENLESQFLAKYGNRYFNTRDMLSKYGLDVAGVTPTAQDESDMAEGKVPSSLKIDDTHLTNVGNTALGIMIANYIRGLSLDSWNRLTL